MAMPHLGELTSETSNFYGAPGELPPQKPQSSSCIPPGNWHGWILEARALDYLSMSFLNDLWWRSSPNELPTPDEVLSQSPDEREAFFEEHSMDYFHHSIPIMDTYRSTELPPRHSHPPRPPRRTPSPIPPLVASTAPPSGNEIDMRALEYVEEFDHNLMCPICHCPFVTPVKLDCDHVFCQECITHALAVQEVEARSCPSCRKKLNGRTVMAVPKLIDRILDELVVKCPLREDGCTETMSRGSVQGHIDRYCDYTPIRCPWERCALKARRKDADKSWCQHTMLSCRDCREDIMERDLEHHRNVLCQRRKTSCPDCKTEMLSSELAEHLTICPKARFPCDAASYGCDFIGRPEALEQHLATCPLHKLTPFLVEQKSRLEAHEMALKHLQQKNSLYESSFATIQEALNPSPLLGNRPGSSDPEATNLLSLQQSVRELEATHLSSLHQLLREEVQRVSNAVSELDAKASMMIMNESLRNKEDMAHTNAAISTVRMQVHWLMSHRMRDYSQQRSGMIQTPGAGAAGGSSMSRSGGSTSSEDAGGSERMASVASQPVRRLSDVTRQLETKL